MRHAHHTSTGYRECNFHEYLTYKVNCSGQPTDESVFHPLQANVVPIQGWRVEGVVSLG